MESKAECEAARPDPIYGTVTIRDGNNNLLTASAAGNRFLFTGREYLAELGFYDYRNRMYSALLGRFMQTDPIRFDAGDINIYRYAGSNPIRYVDPSGEAVGEGILVGGAIGIVGGFATGMGEIIGSSVVNALEGKPAMTGSEMNYVIKRDTVVGAAIGAFGGAFVDPDPLSLAVASGIAGVGLGGIVAGAMDANHNPTPSAAPSDPGPHTNNTQQHAKPPVKDPEPSSSPVAPPVTIPVTAPSAPSAPRASCTDGGGDWANGYV